MVWPPPEVCHNEQSQLTSSQLAHQNRTPEKHATMNPWEQIEFIKRVLATYRDYLAGLASRVDGAYPAAVQMICECSGAVITTGMGN